MCGRYNIVPNAEAWLDAFKIMKDQGLLFTLLPRYNVAPSQGEPAVRVDPESGERAACLLRWGLIPHWAKDKNLGYKCINARAETVAEKPAFRDAFKRRRCLLPANGFYEWEQSGGRKQPYNIRMKGGRPFAFAGLWEHWEQEGEAIESRTLLVTEPNELVAPLHDRMPVILSPGDYDLWLNTEVTAADALAPLLKSYPAEDMEAYPVIRAVGDPKNDSPELVERLKRSPD